VFFYNLRIFNSGLTKAPPQLRHRQVKLSVGHTYLRSAKIPPQLVGKRFAVYNGYRFTSFIVKKYMVGRKFGEFSLTKKLGRTIHNTKKNRRISKVKNKK
jgi:ribosomal protein S19